MIVVVDTNVWISALVFSGGTGVPFHALARAAIEDTIATCAEIESEIEETLRLTFDWRDSRIAAVLNDVLRRAIRVTLYNTVHLCRDPDDDKILECAERAKADLIITGDKDLLSLRVHRRTRIVTPAVYLRINSDAPPPRR
jgi:putative PIN family toxin of toxin-antitoxin system